MRQIVERIYIAMCNWFFSQDFDSGVHGSDRFDFR